MKKFITLSLILAATLFLQACRWSSEQGPVGMRAIQKAQQQGKFSTKEFKIIDINSQNITRYNKRQAVKSHARPPIDLTRTYSDAIRPYDKLTLQVVEASRDGGAGNTTEPVDLGPFEVPQSGKISVPYAGELNVKGRTISAVQNEIQKFYSTAFNTAKVSLNRSSRLPLRANVIGIANAPGQQTIDRQGFNLADLVAKGGGTSQEPFTCEYILHRNKRSYKLNNREITTKNILAQDGDTLEIRKSTERAVTILGAVNRPGSYPFPNYDSHLDDFIGEGSGFRSDSADVRGVFIFRQVSSSTTNIYRFNLREPSGVIAASRFAVHGNDIIYITEAPLTRWNRTIRNILPFSQVPNIARASN